jgi:Domain of unknown function (DUF5107)
LLADRSKANCSSESGDVKIGRTSGRRFLAKSRCRERKQTVRNRSKASRWLLIRALLVGTTTAWSYLTGLPAAAADSTSIAASLRRFTVKLRYIEYEFALVKSEQGIPRLDWKRLKSRPRKVVAHARDAIVLENSHLRATIIPKMGRLHSFVHKPSGKEQLWGNPIAIPIPAHNDTGFWVTWGGVEAVLPRGEHGTSHALEWNYVVEEDGPNRKTVRTWCIEPLTGLEHTLSYRIYRDKEFLETVIEIRNPGKKDIRFSHWTTALLAPGGRGEVSPQTEFIVPAERFVAADRPFNRWMQPLLGPVRTSPLRFAQSWQDIGDLMATPLKRPFYAAYSHEEDMAVVRTLDLQQTPGFNIWMWGYPPSAARQKEYSAAPSNRGYVEFWNGTAKDFTDAALSTLRPGQVLSWRERMSVLTGLRSVKDISAAIQERCRIP